MIPSEYIEPEVSQASVADPEPGPSTTPAVKCRLEQELCHQGSIVATGIEVRNQEIVHGVEVTVHERVFQIISDHDKQHIPERGNPFEEPLQKDTTESDMFYMNKNLFGKIEL
ncbi:hypothetical protein LOTGIDRAFT_167019 [Lottia gigantea]|uniref:Uncharacterized protein n=1 Tax=Lottia gigantea TaxID=225164 RepID=V3ZZS4_LOTGI|nr:hypothetical protein LOTGIDRAFT_167019 [Lottia gigantea]ESO86501.1 hypothetical protein LOTGIDRAFT_167019 [Lottia gigantea]